MNNNNYYYVNNNNNNQKPEEKFPSAPPLDNPIFYQPIMNLQSSQDNNNVNQNLFPSYFPTNPVFIKPNVNLNQNIDPNLNFNQNIDPNYNFNQNINPNVNLNVNYNPQTQIKNIIIGTPLIAYKSGFACNKCSITFESGRSFWHCGNFSCNNYDLCEECEKKEKHYHEMDHYSGEVNKGLPIGYNIGGNVACDSCKKEKLDLFFHKDNENYDLCENCYSKAFVQNNFKCYYYKYVQTIPMVEGIPSDVYSQGFKCDNCMLKFPFAKSFHHCGLCNDNFDLCESCFHNKTYHTHQLVKYTGKAIIGKPIGYSGNVTCDSCKKKGIKKFFHKDNTNFDLCSGCYEKQDIKYNDFQFYDISKFSKIILGVPSFNYNQGFVCDYCKTRHYTGKPFYHCSICQNFDLCENCSFNHPHNHEMNYFSGESVPGINYANCDGCKKTYINKYFHKDGFNFDYCIECFENRNDLRLNDFTYTVFQN